MSLPDDVSLRTSEHYGTKIASLWELWGQWGCLVGGLQGDEETFPDTPITWVACNAISDLQGSIYNALTGFYRLAFTSLRAVVENMTVGLAFQLEESDTHFSEWKDGKAFGLGWAADYIRKHPRISILERELLGRVGEDLYQPFEQNGNRRGLVRDMFKHLSQYTHGGARHNDSAMWESNGPIFVAEVFEDWSQWFFSVYALAVLQSRLAEPALHELPWGATWDTRGLFNHTVEQIDSGEMGRRLLKAVPADVW